MYLKDDTGRAWLEISLENIKWNYERLMECVPKETKCMAIVKADGYGHGAVKVSQMLEKIGCEYFAVAALDEALELRNANIDKEILVLGYTMPQDAFLLEKYNIVQTIADLNHAKQLNQSGHKVRTHLAIDTGMNRLGIHYQDYESIKEVLSLENIKVEGVFSHFSVADSNTKSDVAFTRHQIEAFTGLWKKLQQDGYSNLSFHMQSSYAMMFYPMENMQYVRPGIALYGCGSNSSEEKFPIPLKPCLELKCRIGCIRKVSIGEYVSYGRTYEAKEERTVAVAAIGYADGLPRSLSGKGMGLIHGVRVPILGRICMDQTMFDITGIDGICEGDIVTLIGTDGNQEIKAVDMAMSAGTITNELLSRLGSRLVKTYSKEDK